MLVLSVSIARSGPKALPRCKSGSILKLPSFGLNIKSIYPMQLIKILYISDVFSAPSLALFWYIIYCIYFYEMFRFVLVSYDNGSFPGTHAIIWIQNVNSLIALCHMWKILLKNCNFNINNSIHKCCCQQQQFKIWKKKARARCAMFFYFKILLMEAAIQNFYCLINSLIHLFINLCHSYCHRTSWIFIMG